MAQGDKTVSTGPKVTFSSGRVDDKTTASSSSNSPDVRLLHYNDVYHVDQSSSEPVGGVSRFVTLCREYREGKKFEGQSGLLTLFSGDAFNPSLESSVTKGRHMVPVLNAIKTDCACVGNHDFDFGMAQFRDLTSKCNFPWLLANVLDPALGENVPLGNAKATHMLTTTKGIKVGIIGLGEREWLETINSLPPNLIYKSASETAKELVPKLRAEGAEMVVCLSHMREPNDKKLAENTDGLMDIILGGHDHYYSHSFIKGTHVLRSGTDFKQLSYIEARRKNKASDDNGGSATWDFDIWRRDITSEIPADEPTQKLVDQLTSKLQKSLSRPIGWTAMPLDARFSTVRLRESNLGNFACDIMRHYHAADCTIMASGTIRGDQVYPPGAVRVKDVTTCFPFEDPVVVLRVTGQAIWDALENGVSMYPALEGRFPQVSNISFGCDVRKERGERLTFLEIGGRKYEPDRKYVLVTRGYMGRGKDGYTSLLVQSEGGEAEEIVHEENGVLISTMLRQYFMGLRTVGRWQHTADHWINLADKAHKTMAPRRTSVDGETAKMKKVVSKSSEGGDPGPSWSDFLHRRKGLHRRPLDEDRDHYAEHDDPHGHRTQTQTKPGSTDMGGAAAAGDSSEDDNGELDDQMDLETLLMRKFWARWARKAGVKSKACDGMGGEDVQVDWTRVIAPVVEGRIQIVGGEEVSVGS